MKAPAKKQGARDGLFAIPDGPGLGIAVAAGLMTGIGDHTSIAYLLVAYLAFGFGFGLVNAPISNAAVSGMPNAQAGVAASIASAGRQIGSSLGVAISGSIVAGASAAGFASASHAAWAVLAAAGLAVVVVGLISTSPRAREGAARMSENFAR